MGVPLHLARSLAIVGRGPAGRLGLAFAMDGAGSGLPSRM